MWARAALAALTLVSVVLRADSGDINENAPLALLVQHVSPEVHARVTSLSLTIWVGTHRGILHSHTRTESFYAA
jgi:hypothetical protein